MPAHTWSDLHDCTCKHMFTSLSLQLEGLYRGLTVINQENNFCISCIIWSWIEVILWFPGGASCKEPTYQCRRDVRDVGSTPGLGRSPGGGQVIHSSILAWRIPQTEEPGRLQSMESQTEGHNWGNLAHRDIIFFCKGSKIIHLYRVDLCPQPEMASMEALK